MTFDEWWKQTKPEECDELKQVFEECWENSAVWWNSFFHEAKTDEEKALHAAIIKRDTSA